VWLPVTDGQRSLNFAGYHPLAVHPANPALVFGAVCGAGAGVLRSANHGLSWQLLGNALLEGASIGSLAVHPTNPNESRFHVDPDAGNGSLEWLIVAGLLATDGDFRAAGPRRADAAGACGAEPKPPA